MKYGSILIYSLLIMSVILAISLSLNAAFLRNLGNIREAQDSVRALYAADGAVEFCLFEARRAEPADAFIDRAEQSPECANAPGRVAPSPDPQGGTTAPPRTNQSTDEECTFSLPEDANGRSASFKITNLEPTSAQVGVGETMSGCLSISGDSALNIRATGEFQSANRSLEISY